MNSKILILAGITLMTALGLSGCSKSADSNGASGNTDQAQQQPIGQQDNGAQDNSPDDASQQPSQDDDSDADDMRQGIPPDESQKQINPTPESDPQSGTLEGNSSNIQEDQ